jgi:TonB family protein
MKPHDAAPAVRSDELPQLERFTRWLIQHAARNSPAALADRLEEEWLADLAAQHGPLLRLRFAVGCCWATRVIAHDYLASGAAASPAATGPAAVIYGQHDLSFFSRRTTIFVLIVGLHVIVIYGFATGFAQKVIDRIPGPIVATLLNPPEKDVLPPPPIRSHLESRRTPPLIPELAPTFDFQQAPIEDRFIPPPSQPPTPPSHTVTRILGGPGEGFPNTGDYYPPMSIRLRETGVATVKVCVDDRGRLASVPVIAKSSGISRLDEAALRLAKAGSGRYRSTTDDGTAVTNCFPFRIRFQLKD